MFDVSIPARTWGVHIDAEYSVLGAALQDPDAVPVLVALREDDFTHPGVAFFRNVIASLYADGQVVDLVTVDARAGVLKPGIMETPDATKFLVSLTQYTPTTANVRAYAAIVMEKSARRKLAKLGEWIARRAQDEAITVDKNVKAGHEYLSRIMTFSDQEDDSAGAVARAGYQYAAMRGDRDDKENTTGIAELDNATGGFHAGEVTILAAATGAGKSTLAWQIADTFTSRGQRVLYISLEMPKDQLGVRWFAQYGTDIQMIRRGKLTADDWERMAKLIPEFAERPLHVRTTLFTPREIEEYIKELKSKGGLALVVIDYLQLLQSGKRTQNNTAEVTEISHAVKRMALRQNVPMLVLAQLNREIYKRDIQMPKLSDLRESGAIEQDADNIWFIFTPDSPEKVYSSDIKTYGDLAKYGNMLTYLEIAKQRQDFKGRLKLCFRPETLKTYSLTDGLVPVTDHSDPWREKAEAPIAQLEATE